MCDIQDSVSILDKRHLIIAAASSYDGSPTFAYAFTFLSLNDLLLYS
jgi:hypothetical protein